MEVSHTDMQSKEVAGKLSGYWAPMSADEGVCFSGRHLPQQLVESNPWVSWPWSKRRDGFSKLADCILLIAPVVSFNIFLGVYNTRKLVATYRGSIRVKYNFFTGIAFLFTFTRVPFGIQTFYILLYLSLSIFSSLFHFLFTMLTVCLRGSK